MQIKHLVNLEILWYNLTTSTWDGCLLNISVIYLNCNCYSKICGRTFCRVFMFQLNYLSNSHDFQIHISQGHCHLFAYWNVYSKVSRKSSVFPFVHSFLIGDVNVFVPKLWPSTLTKTHEQLLSPPGMESKASWIGPRSRRGVLVTLGKSIIAWLWGTLLTCFYMVHLTVSLTPFYEPNN